MGSCQWSVVSGQLSVISEQNGISSATHFEVVNSTYKRNS